MSRGSAPIIVEEAFADETVERAGAALVGQFAGKSVVERENNSRPIQRVVAIE